MADYLTMANNHHFFTMNPQQKLNRLLLQSSTDNYDRLYDTAIVFARKMAEVENVIAVVSDLAEGKSTIFNGGFADTIGLPDYCHEDSIWETRIISLMSPHEQNEKYIAELRFFHFLRHLPKNKRPQHYLVSKLRFELADGTSRDILHRMYYFYAPDLETVRYAVCIYGPLSFDMPGKSHVVNSITGITEALTTSANHTVLTRRERQILSLIDSGLKSAEIAAKLHISIHTVNRHRQEILRKMHVKNSHEACCLAKSMSLI